MIEEILTKVNFIHGGFRKQLCICLSVQQLSYIVDYIGEKKTQAVVKITDYELRKNFKLKQIKKQ